MTVSAWARERFGEAAGPLQKAVGRAIPRAHGDAVAAQAASGTRKLDPYGHTMKNRQHECLVAAAREISGVEVFRPKGVAFELVRVPAARAVLFPWRYAKDESRSLEETRMRTSGFRRDLLAGSTEASGQLTLEHASMDDAELEAQLVEDEELFDQLRSFARVVTIAYASNPKGILHLVWGDAELLDADGTMTWRYSEPLPVLAADGTAARPAGGGQPDKRGADDLRSPLRTGTDRPDARAPRFDDSPLNNDFNLRPRNQPGSEPPTEPAPDQQDTGTEDEQS